MNTSSSDPMRLSSMMPFDMPTTTSANVISGRISTLKLLSGQKPLYQSRTLESSSYCFAAMSSTPR